MRQRQTGSSDINQIDKLKFIKLNYKFSRVFHVAKSMAEAEVRSSYYVVLLVFLGLYLASV